MMRQEVKGWPLMRKGLEAACARRGLNINLQICPSAGSFGVTASDDYSVKRLRFYHDVSRV